MTDLQDFSTEAQVQIKRIDQPVDQPWVDATSQSVTNIFGLSLRVGNHFRIAFYHHSTVAQRPTQFGWIHTQ